MRSDINARIYQYEQFSGLDTRKWREEVIRQERNNENTSIRILH